MFWLFLVYINYIYLDSQDEVKSFEEWVKDEQVANPTVEKEETKEEIKLDKQPGILRDEIQNESDISQMEVNESSTVLKEEVIKRFDQAWQEGEFKLLQNRWNHYFPSPITFFVFGNLLKQFSLYNFMQYYWNYTFFSNIIINRY